MINSIGGWSKLCSMDNKQIEFAKRDYLKNYKVFDSTNKEHIPVALIGHSGEVRVTQHALINVKKAIVPIEGVRSTLADIRAMMNKGKNNGK